MAAWPETSLMGSLTPSDRAALLTTGTRVQFSDDDILVMQGDIGDVLYVLTGGMVKITVSAESGIETMLAQAIPMPIIGRNSTYLFVTAASLKSSTSRTTPSTSTTSPCGTG